MSDYGRIVELWVEEGLLGIIDDWAEREGVVRSRIAGRLMRAGLERQPANVPTAVWIEMHLIQSALADLTRALVNDDRNYIVGDLRKIAYHRNKLVNELQTWQPELRISAPCDD